MAGSFCKFFVCFSVGDFFLVVFPSQDGSDPANAPANALANAPANTPTNAPTNSKAPTNANRQC